jgi:hypothetical protein
MCHLEPQRLRQLSDWVGSYREFWEESFGRLDELLEELGAPAASPIVRSNKGSAASKGNRGREEGEGT